MNHPRLNLIALLLTSLLALGIASAPGDADACSPPMQGIFLDDGVEFDEYVPVKGSWAVRVRTQDASIEDLSIEVGEDASDAPIEGSVSHILIDERDDGSFGISASYLVIWTPTEELRPGQLHRVTLRSSGASFQPVDESTTFRTIAYPTPDDDPSNLELATVVGEPVIRIDEQQGDLECCFTPDFCNSCGGCEQCWPTAYVYRPTIDLEVELPENDLAMSGKTLQAYHRIETSNGGSKFYWDRRGRVSTSFYFNDGDSDPYCVTLKTFSLATQEVLGERETCFARSDLPPYTERELEGVTRPETCEYGPDAGGEPDAGEQPDTREQPDTGAQPDAGDQPDTGDQPEPPEIGADADAGCGCTATPNAPTSLLGMMLFFIALGTSRLSLFSGRD